MTLWRWFRSLFETAPDKRFEVKYGSNQRAIIYAPSFARAQEYAWENYDSDDVIELDVPPHHALLMSPWLSLGTSAQSEISQSGGMSDTARLIGYAILTVAFIAASVALYPDAKREHEQAKQEQ